MEDFRKDLSALYFAKRKYNTAWNALRRLCRRKHSSVWELKGSSQFVTYQICRERYQEELFLRIDRLQDFQDYLGKEAIALGTKRVPVEKTPTQQPEWKRGLVGFHPPGLLLGGSSTELEVKTSEMASLAPPENQGPQPQVEVNEEPSEPEQSVSTQAHREEPQDLPEHFFRRKARWLVSPSEGFVWYAAKLQITLLYVSLLLLIPVKLASPVQELAGWAMLALPSIVSTVTVLIMYLLLLLLNPKVAGTSGQRVKPYGLISWEDVRRLKVGSVTENELKARYRRQDSTRLHAMRFSPVLGTFYYPVRVIANIVGLYTWGVVLPLTTVLQLYYSVTEYRGVDLLMFNTYYPLWLISYQIAYEVHLRPLLAAAREEVFGIVA